MDTQNNENTTPSVDSPFKKRVYTERFLVDVFMRLDDRQRNVGVKVSASQLIEISYHLPREESDRLANGWLRTLAQDKPVEDRVREFMSQEGMI